MEIRRLGRVEYEPTWRAMQEFTASRAPETPDELWIVEHPPVYTLGQAGPAIAEVNGYQQVVVLALTGLVPEMGLFLKDHLRPEIRRTVERVAENSPIWYMAWKPATLGAEGAILRTREGEERIDPAAPDDVQDPTGCGDAFRSGLIYGLLNDLDLVTACRIGAVMGAIKVAIQGPQNHNPSRDEIGQRFFDTYGYRF